MDLTKGLSVSFATVTKKSFIIKNTLLILYIQIKKYKNIMNNSELKYKSVVLSFIISQIKNPFDCWYGWFEQTNYLRTLNQYQTPFDKFIV